MQIYNILEKLTWMRGWVFRNYSVLLTSALDQLVLLLFYKSKQQKIGEFKK